MDLPGKISLLTALLCAVASAAQIQGYLIDKACEQRIKAGGRQRVVVGRPAGPVSGELASILCFSGECRPTVNAVVVSVCGL